MADLESSHEMPKIISFLSSLLQRVAESNDENRQFDQQKITVFHGLTRPTISIHSYLARIFKYANCSSSCFIVAYVYLDRFVQRQPSLPINSFNVHRLLITSVLVAAKFMDDMWVLEEREVGFDLIGQMGFMFFWFNWESPTSLKMRNL